MKRRASLVIGLLDGLGGGTEQHVLALCEGLPVRGVDVDVVCVFDHPFLATHPLPVPVTALCAGARALWRLQAPARLRRHWDATRPDAAVAFFDNAQLAATAAARGSGGPAVLAARRNMGTERAGLAAWGLRRSNRSVRGFVCNSEAVRDALVRREGVPREKTRVLYNGIDLSPVQPEAWRAAEGVPDDAPVVACVSGQRPIKGVDVFLKAFAQVTTTVPAAHALLVGDGTERPALAALAATLGIADRTHFVGWRDDARPLLAGCAAGALASHSEGFSNAILEYMAAGLPVVATRVGGNAEAVREGVDGFLVEPGDVAALAGALGGLLRDPARAREMGCAARCRAEARFDREGMLDQMAQILDEAASA